MPELVAAKPQADWRVNNFDLIRLFAALQVAVVHAITHLRLSGTLVHILDFGLRLFPGVPIFFVVSGFLISNSYERTASLRDYCRNRCLRIFPGLWVSLAVMCLLQHYSQSIQWLLGVGTPNDSLWTIPIELEFYALVPALYLLIRPGKRSGNLLLLVVGTASAALHLGFLYRDYVKPGQVDNNYLLSTVAPYLWMFLVGVLTQRNWDRLSPFIAGRVLWWLCGYLLLCAGATYLGISIGSNTMTPIFFVPLAGLVFASATTSPSLAGKFYAARIFLTGHTSITCPFSTSWSALALLAAYFSP